MVARVGRGWPVASGFPDTWLREAPGRRGSSRSGSLVAHRGRERRAEWCLAEPEGRRLLSALAACRVCRVSAQEL